KDFKLYDWLDQQGVPPPILGVSRAGAVAIKQAAYTGVHQPTMLVKPQPRIEAFLVPVGSVQLGNLTETQLSQTKVMTVGRQAGVYLLIDHSSVSRRHAEISYANGQYILHDLGSTNGTYVNDTRMEPGSTSILKPGDQVRLGKIARFVFQLRSVGVEPAPTHSSS